MANTLTFEQSAALLNELAEQATGSKSQAPVNTAEFITVANTVLNCGYNAVVDAISQVLGRTIFSIRPYYRKFPGLNKSEQTWGNHARKINYVDGTWVNDDSVPLTDGDTLDHYIISKPNVLQTNFYGGMRRSRFYTMFREQLRTAFTGPNELSQFWSGLVTHTNNQIEQGHENLARTAINNFIGGKIAADNGVIHLLTEYNDLTGGNLTATTVFAPNNFQAFVRWMYSRVKVLMRNMTERTVLNHLNVTGSEIARHTPLELQRVYLYAPFVDMMDSMVNSTTFNDDYLKKPRWEAVNYWQSPDKPDSIDVTPSYMGTDGTIKTATAAVQQGDIIGTIFDDEAIGYTTFDATVLSTPVNARGQYWNIWYHWVDRYWNDFTENGYVLLLD